MKFCRLVYSEELNTTNNMPTIEERLTINNPYKEKEEHEPPQPAPAPHLYFYEPTGGSPLSNPGNPAPNRGLPPQDFVYDFQTARFFPDNHLFNRGYVETITPVRNLALQALIKAGGKVV